jgi:hypothetical protein
MKHEPRLHATLRNEISTGRVVAQADRELVAG